MQTRAIHTPMANFCRYFIIFLLVMATTHLQAQQTATLTASKDTEISSTKPDDGFAADDEIRIDGSPDHYALFYWDVSSLPANATIQAARIELYIFNDTSDDYYVYPVNADWAESITWNQFMNNVGYSTQNLLQNPISPGGTGVYQFEFSAQGISEIQSWLTNASNNHGIIIAENDPNSTSGWEFYSREHADETKRPKLIIDYTTTGASPPDIAAAPASYDYGDVQTGSSSSNTFVISNDGTGDLNISAVSLTGAGAGEFNIISGGSSTTVTPGATHDIVVDFIPTATGVKNATLQISSDDPDENPLDIALAGNGASTPVPDIAASPATFDYGSVQINSSSSHTFTISNAGTGDLSITATSLVGADPGEFSIASGGGAITLTPGGSNDIVLDFSPTATGAKSAILRINSDDPNEDPLDVSLAGSGATSGGGSSLWTQDGAGNIIYYGTAAGQNVGIGTTTPGSYRLAVEGTIGAREVVVTTDAWSDFVFDKDYSLKSLEEIEAFIARNKHLPDIPSEADVTQNGVKVGEMHAKLLQKIEELTLYLIQLKKENEALKVRVFEIENGK